MALSDDLTSDLDTLFETDEFAVEAIYFDGVSAPSTVPVILSNEEETIDLAEGAVIDNRPSCLVKEADVPRIARGHSLRIDSVTYIVESVKADGYGLMDIGLSEKTV